MNTNSASRTFLRLAMLLLAGSFGAHCLAQEATGQKKNLAEELISLMRLDRSMAAILEQRVKMEESADATLSQE
jgi:hypothetical protein